MIHDRMPMPYDDLIQGQGHEGPKVVKVADFNVCLLRRYACNQMTGGRWIVILQDNILILSGQISDIRPRSASCDLQS